MKKLLFILSIIFVLNACTNEQAARKALLDSGFHPITVGGYEWGNGSDGDLYITKFKAYSPDSSRIVTGVVCSGWFKGSTIRLD